MSRWVLVALAGAAGLLLWTIATWPVEPAPGTDTFEDSAAATAAAEVPVQPALPAAYLPPQPTAAEQELQEPEAPEGLAEPAATIQEPKSAAEVEADSLFIRENGPLAEYKTRFANEPRDSAASDAEQLVRSAFELKDGPRLVFRSVLCRETICKIETRFAPETLGAYVAAMTRMVHNKFDAALATERTSLAEAGEVSVTVYAKRPAAQH